MRKFIIGGIGAIVLALGFTAGNASAYWATRTAYRWDPAVGVYVPVVERVWVPEPVVYAPSYYYGFYPYRSWYYHDFHHHHGHHDHHHNHH